jgi:hypothetical protein
MGRAYSTNGEEEECIEANVGETRKKESTRTILKWILERGWDGVEWINVAQDRVL